MIKIWRPNHVAFAANILVKKLQSMGEKVYIVDKIDPSDACLYIIYNASSVKRLPNNYIVYQTEVAGSKWFSRKYLATLKNALAIWEYNSDNIKAYKHLNPNISIVSPGYEPQAVNVTRDIPLLFYGYTKKSPLRLNLLQAIQNKIDIKVVEDELTTGMWSILSRTGVVLNIHYYENAPLEMFRINEALSFGCSVISQTSPTIPDKYNNIVRFADTTEEMLSLVEEFGNFKDPLPDREALNLLRNDSEIEQAMAKPFELRKPKIGLLKQLFQTKLSGAGA